MNDYQPLFLGSLHIKSCLCGALGRDSHREFRGLVPGPRGRSFEWTQCSHSLKTKWLHLFVCTRVCTHVQTSHSRYRCVRDPLVRVGFLLSPLNSGPRAGHKLLYVRGSCWPGGDPAHMRMIYLRVLTRHGNASQPPSRWWCAKCL